MKKNVSWCAPGWRIACAGLLFAHLLTVAGHAQRTQTERPVFPTATVTPSRIHTLMREDQSEKPGNISGAEFYRHGAERRAEIRTLLDEGKILDAQDFADAALIFQHGEGAEDFLLAHILATAAVVLGHAPSAWLAAATLDRYLMTLGKAQVFGTQYSGVKSPENTPKPMVDPGVLNIQRTQEPYERNLLSDSIREVFCVPGLELQAKNLATFNTGHRPRSMRAAGCSQ